MAIVIKVESLKPRPTAETISHIKPPSATDAVPLNRKVDKETEPSATQKQFLLQFLGTAVYKCRRRNNQAGVAALTALPKGYLAEYINGSFSIKGHPSRECFKNETSFLPHLLWLEQVSFSKNFRQLCECELCENVRQKNHNASHPDPSTRILYKMGKVLIRPPKTPYEIPSNFTIPLPKLKKSNENILLNSRQNRH